MVFFHYPGVNSFGVSPNVILRNDFVQTKGVSRRGRVSLTRGAVINLREPRGRRAMSTEQKRGVKSISGCTRRTHAVRMCLHSEHKLAFIPRYPI